MNDYYEERDIMKIELVRSYNCPTYCIGHLYVDGVYLCDTVEDTDRGLDQSWTLEQIKRKKVYKMTAIPTGTYEVTMSIRSPKFSQYEYYLNQCNGYMPRILSVKGYEGILIHCGSSANSSAGCIIVGYNTIKGKVTNSRSAWEKLMAQLNKAKKAKEKVTIKITRKYKVAA